MQNSITKFALASIANLDTVIGGGGKCKAKSGKSQKSGKSRKSNGNCRPC